MTFQSEKHYVYHVTTLDRAEQCLVEGIIPFKSSECDNDGILIDTKYDAARPSGVTELGISRQTSVYAHPDFENALERHNGGWLGRVQQKLAVLSINVTDLERTYVCDAYLINRAAHRAEDYWHSLVPLVSYRSQDDPTYVALHNRPYSNRPTTFRYMWPEVLLPGTVEPERIALKEVTN